MSLDVKRAINYILETVREVCDDLTSEYEAGLRKLFACTLAYIPEERDLDKAIHILECMSSGSLSALPR